MQREVGGRQREVGGRQREVGGRQREVGGRRSARLPPQRESSHDNDALDLGNRLLRLAKHLEISRRDVLARRELEVWEYDVLLALRAAESSEGLSPGELMAATQVASGTVTNRIDRLVARGLVSREPDPRDGRGVLVRLRTSGRKRVDQATRDLTKAEGAMWESLSERRRAQLTGLLRDLLDAHGAG